MTKYISQKNFVISDSCGEAVLAPISADTANMGSLLALNETGAAIIRMMEEGKTVDEMAAEIAEQYDAPDAAKIRADIMAFASKLVAKGFFRAE